ncbi:MAG: hypothetical protein WA974_14365 [Thermodesulfobacteriota bacterium]
MKNAKTLFLWVFLILVVGMIGCNSGGSSSGGSTPATTTSTTTNPLVGTWNPVGGGTSLTFKTDGTGSLSDGVHTINSWTLSSSNVLNMTLNGTPEVFQVTFTNDAKTAMTLHNIGPNSSETTAYTKS